MGHIFGMIDTSPVIEKLVTRLKSDDQYHNSYTRIISHSGQGLVEAFIANAPSVMASADGAGIDDNPWLETISAPIANGSGIALAAVESCRLEAGQNHPHAKWRPVSQDIAVIWQGTFDNLATLTATYLHDKPAFSYKEDPNQNTISDKITALIRHFQQSEVDPVASVWALLNRLKGQYILAVLFANKPDQIVVACQDHHISIGRNEDGVMLIGEALNGDDGRLLDPIHLGGRALALVTPTNITPIDHGFDHQPALWPQLVKSRIIAEKMRSPMQIYDDIFAQADIFYDLDDYRGAWHQIMARLVEKAPSIQKIVLLSCHKTYHLGRIAQTWFENYAGIAVSVKLASEYRYEIDSVAAEPANTVGLVIAQSAEIDDILACIHGFAKYNFPCFAIIGANNAELAYVVDGTIPTFRHWQSDHILMPTILLVTLLRLAVELGLKNTKLSAKKFAKLRAEMADLPTISEAVYALEERIIPFANLMLQAPQTLVIGRGEGYLLAKAGRVIIQDIAGSAADSIPAGELKHGAISHQKTPLSVITLAPHDARFAKTLSNAHGLMQKNHTQCVITDHFAIEKIANSDHITYVTLPEMTDLQRPFGFLIAIQLLACRAGLIKYRESYSRDNFSQPPQLAVTQ